MGEENKKLLHITPEGWMQVFVISIAILLAIFLLGNGWESSLYDGPSATPEFAQCIAESGAVFYWSAGCPHCQSQKAMFGKSFGELNSLNCGEEHEACRLAGINAYPTWIIDGNRYLGSRSLETLGVLTGCEAEL
ncbi:hypothetical protein GF412_01005 [Candidatus Micrarchaeota archaeon]|nr:hypothetical protein [Candidatus Micrarchaeota archaeon]MBD3417551.1 hypothetical protein [Candidatus Micrarchaeota archaeon]